MRNRPQLPAASMLGALALGMLMALPAAAETPVAPKSKYAGIIHPLDWGAATADVFDKLKSELDARYRDQMKTSDTIKIDRLMREKSDEMERIRKSLVRFDGQRSGYETSLIAGEVVPREGESLIRVDDRVAQRYYIMRNDGLWKVVVTYNVSTMGTFQEFVDAVRAKYGNPKKASFSDDSGERRITAVTWEDGHTRMVARDESEFYSSYVMKFVQVGRGTDLEQARADRPRTRKTASDSRAEGLMADIFDSESSGAADDLVDEITGIEAEVDLESGRPQEYAVPQMAEDTDVKKKKRKKARKARKKKAAPAKTATPDIIY